MKKILILLASTFLLSGCFLIPVHKMDIEQGNVITPELADRVHVGMSASQVKEIMGSPVLLNTFNDDRVDYIYTFKPGRGDMYEKYLILTLRNGIVTGINKSI